MASQSVSTIEARAMGQIENDAVHISGAQEANCITSAYFIRHRGVSTKPESRMTAGLLLRRNFKEAS
jgi:hypothetical protein